MGKRTFFLRALGILTCLMPLFSGSSWALTGKLIDNSGNALAGATVKLIRANISGTTDSAGVFDLEKLAGNLTAENSKNIPFIQNGMLSFTMLQAGKAEISLYSVSGARVGRISENFSSGLQTVALANCLTRHGAGLYFVLLRRGSNTRTFRYFYTGESSEGVTHAIRTSSSSILTKAAVGDSIVDTLLISKVNGDVTSTRKVKIYGYDDNINDYMSSGKQIVILDPSNDNDGDGLTNYEERYVYFTNSELYDTDGDGVSDYDETVDGKDPLVANVPDFSFTVATYPQMVASYTTSEGTSTEESVSESEEYTESSTFSSTQEVNWKAELAVMVGGEYSWGKDGGAKVSGSVTTTIGAGGSISFSEEYSESLAKNWENTKTYATSTDMTFSGGTISVDLTFTNNSGTNLTLVDPVVRLSTNGYQINALSTQIGELQLSGNATTIYIPSASGSNSVTRTFTASISNPNFFDEIANKANGLTVQLQNIKFLTALGETDTLMDNVYNRTALVLVDYGNYLSGKSVIKKYVVTRNKYNEFYTSQADRFISSSLSDILKTAGATVTNDSTDGHYGIQSIDGLANGTIISGGWGVVLQNSNDTDSVTVYGVGRNYDPDSIKAYGNSVIDVLYSADEDGDNLTDRAEAVLGTDPEEMDTDGDGIPDGDEVYGWKSLDLTQDTVWETNPLLKDTDGDGLNDSADSDPLTAFVSPKDSLVMLSKISVIPVQGSTWSKAMVDTDTTTRLSVTVDSAMHGPASLELTFSHNIYMMIVMGNSDTTALYTPSSDTDSSVTYKASLPLVLGTNAVQVIMYSKNGVQKKVLNLTIERRLIQVDPTNAAFFKVSAPSADLMGVAANIYVNVDSIMKLDPLVTSVYLMRIDLNRLSSSASDSVQAMIAQDLGSSGNGDANLSVGSLTSGKGSGTQNTYRVVSVLTSTNTITNTDSTIKRRNDLIYFPYAANTGRSDGKNYLTATRTGKGIFYSNPRSIMIDSMFAFMMEKTGSYNSVVQMSVSINGALHSSRNDNWRPAGINVPKMTDTIFINQELGSGGRIQFNNYVQNGSAEGWFRIELGLSWVNVDTQPDSITYNQIIYPNDYLVSNYTYGAETLAGVVDTLWKRELDSRGSALSAYAFDEGFHISWHFKEGGAHTYQGK